MSLCHSSAPWTCTPPLKCRSPTPRSIRISYKCIRENAKHAKQVSLCLTYVDFSSHFWEAFLPSSQVYMQYIGRSNFKRKVFSVLVFENLLKRSGYMNFQSHWNSHTFTCNLNTKIRNQNSPCLPYLQDRWCETFCLIALCVCIKVNCSFNYEIRNIVTFTACYLS
jgi:hypothetical protein